MLSGGGYFFLTGVLFTAIIFALNARLDDIISVSTKPSILIGLLFSLFNYNGEEQCYKNCKQGKESAK